jgi:hypothetical protein
MIIETLPKFIRGMVITRNGDGTFTYNPNVQVESKLFETKHYFFPIPQIERNRNPNLAQNPHW